MAEIKYKSIKKEPMDEEPIKKKPMLDVFIKVEPKEEEFEEEWPKEEKPGKEELKKLVIKKEEPEEEETKDVKPNKMELKKLVIKKEEPEEEETKDVKPITMEIKEEKREDVKRKIKEVKAEACVCCSECFVLINSTVLICHEGRIYCSRCFKKKYSTRCFKCKEIISGHEFKYRNKRYHNECFSCKFCNRGLTRRHFITHEEKPSCYDCFGRLFTNPCNSCKNNISVISGIRYIAFEGRQWHYDCFICADCSESLINRGFMTDRDQILCPFCARKRLELVTIDGRQRGVHI